MAKNIDEKLNIQDAIKAFSKDDISNAGINLFSVLGYDTSLQAPLDNKTYEEFKTNYIETSPSAERFNEEKALTSEWKSIDILFQLTDDSFTGQQQLFDSKLNPLNPQSYLCFAVGLNNNEYSKTQIASITREVNKDTINLSIRGLHFQLSTNCRQFNSIFRVTALLHFEPIITQMHTVS